MRRQLRGQRSGPVEVDAESAARPEQELGNALEVGEIARRLGIRVGQNGGREMGDASVCLFQAFLTSRNKSFTRRLNTSGGTPRNREATFTRLFT